MITKTKIKPEEPIKVFYIYLEGSGNPSEDHNIIGVDYGSGSIGYVDKYDIEDDH